MQTSNNDLLVTTVTDTLPIPILNYCTNSVKAARFIQMIMQDLWSVRAFSFLQNEYRFMVTNMMYLTLVKPISPVSQRTIQMKACFFVVNTDACARNWKDFYPHISSHKVVPASGEQ